MTRVIDLGSISKLNYHSFLGLYLAVKVNTSLILVSSRVDLGPLAG